MDVNELMFYRYEIADTSIYIVLLSSALYSFLLGYKLCFKSNLVTSMSKYFDEVVSTPCTDDEKNNLKNRPEHLKPFSSNSKFTGLLIDCFCGDRAYAMPVPLEFRCARRTHTDPS